MRSLTTSLWSLLLTVPAYSQGDSDPVSTLRVGFDDGGGDNLWRVASPSGPSDWFNVDFDNTLESQRLVALYCDSGETLGVPGFHADLALFAESSSFPNAPDVLSGRLTGRFNPGVIANDAAGTDDAFLVDTKLDVPIGDHHVAVQFAPGDSHTWVAADTSSPPAGRSYFTASNYSTGAVPFSVNWSLAAGIYEATEPGTLLINGGTSMVSVPVFDTLCMLFFGPSLHTMSVLYLCQSGTPFQIVLPPMYTITDGAMAGPCPQTWQICTATDCNMPLDLPFELCCLYADTTDLMPNGKPRIKTSNSVVGEVRLEASDACGFGGSGDCFGRRDDSVVDSNIWRPQNPAGPSDWFNVNHGRAKSKVTALTGLSISSWDFCGFGPCWAEVGIYAADTSVDSRGCIPDISNPLTSVGGSSACMLPNAADWGVPLTFYDTPDIAADTTTRYHAAVQWPLGGTCIWIGSDSDAADDFGCADDLPNNGCTSLFTTDGYQSSRMPFTEAHWMMQINWN